MYSKPKTDITAMNKIPSLLIIINKFIAKIQRIIAFFYIQLSNLFTKLSFLSMLSKCKVNIVYKWVNLPTNMMLLYCTFERRQKKC